MRNQRHAPLSGITIRDYQEADELNWVRCRVLAFLDSSYRDDVQPYREVYENPAVQIVAIDQQTQQLVGFLDAEFEQRPGAVCSFDGPLGAVIWHLGVLPEFRDRGIADAMWNCVKNRLANQGIQRVQVWTQDDPEANRWYASHGFKLINRYLNVFARGPVNQGPIKDLLPDSADSWKFGHIRTLNFEADVAHREELEALSYRIHEVRGLELRLKPRDNSVQ